TLRLDQLMLGAMASNVAIGLYVTAVRLSEMTTLAADAIADALMPEVASSKIASRAESLCARSLRLAIYMHLLLLPPLWLAVPLIALIGFIKKRQLHLWENCLRPQRRDLLVPNWRSLMGFSTTVR